MKYLSLPYYKLESSKIPITLKNVPQKYIKMYIPSDNFEPFLA